MIGEKFGKLTVISENKELVISGVRRNYFNCKCDCGNEHIVRKDHLTTGKIASCGCLRKNSMIGRPSRSAKAPGEAAARCVWNNYKGKAKKRNYEFDLTLEEFLDLASKPCHYCGRSKVNRWGEYFVSGVRAGQRKVNGAFCYNGVDRKDNTKGYTICNSVPCCGQCNIAKASFSENEFLEWVSLVYQHNQPPKQVHQ